MKPLVFGITKGKNPNLKKYDPRHDAGLSRKQSENQFEEIIEELDELQELLYAAGSHSLLVVLQGMDTSGKDGTTHKIFGKLNPTGYRIASFKVPTEEELSHDFLWRVHHHTPRRGEIVIFNRSHYEDVLVVRVRNLAPEDVWKQRYQQINDFERLLAENNTIILKFFLHISKEEQKERLIEREEEVRKAWKLSASDWQNRVYWKDYQEAYEDALQQCHTDYAPWYIVPADRKWFRNLAIAHTIVEALRPYKEMWQAHLASYQKQALAELDKIVERREELKDE